jgi:hypothetical protein
VSVRSILVLLALAALALVAWVVLWSERPSFPPTQGGDAPAREGAAPGLSVGAGREEDAPRPAGDAPFSDDELMVSLMPEAPPRLGVRFFARLVKARRPMEAMFASGMAEDEGPAVGYPVRIYWTGPEPIEAPVLEGVTGDDGECLLSPLVIPRVPHRLRGAVKLTVEGGGGVWEERSMSFDVAWLLENWEAPVPATRGEPVIGWIPIGFEDWQGTPVSGRVLDPQGKPVAGLTIIESKFHTQVVTDAGGHFALRCPEGEIGLYGGTHGIYGPHLSAPDDPFPTVFLHRRIVTGDAVRDLELYLPKQQRIHGRVRFADGSPASGIQVFLRTRQSQPAVETSESRGDGTFAFIGLRPGARYELVVDADRREDQLVREVMPGPGLVELTVPRHQLRVKLVDAVSGKVVPGETHIYDGERHPGAKLLIFGWAAGYGPVEQPYVMMKTPAVQHVTLRLPRAPPDGLVRVRCLTPDGTRIERPPFFVRVVPDSIAAARWVEQGGYDVTTDLGPGVMTIELDAPSKPHSPGRARHRIGVPGGGPARFLLGMKKKIQVPPSGKLDVDLKPAVGGAMQFRVVIVDKTKQRTMLKKPELLDETGESVGYLTFQRGQFTPWFEHATGSSAVPVGTYRLQMRGTWHKPVDRLVQIEAGRLAYVDIRVEANDD